MRLAARLGERRRDEGGAVVVLIAAMTVVLFGIAALVADLGRSYGSLSRSWLMFE